MRVWFSVVYEYFAWSWYLLKVFGEVTSCYIFEPLLHWRRGYLDFHKDKTMIKTSVNK